MARFRPLRRGESTEEVATLDHFNNFRGGARRGVRKQAALSKSGLFLVAFLGLGNDPLTVTHFISSKEGCAG